MSVNKFSGIVDDKLSKELCEQALVNLKEQGITQCESVKEVAHENLNLFAQELCNVTAKYFNLK